MLKKDFKIEDKSSGLCILTNAFDIDQNMLFEYLNWLKQEQEDTFTYLEEDGKKYAINKTGFKFDLNDISQAPERFVDPLCNMSDRKPTAEQCKLISDLEDLIYEVLVEYVKIYDVASTVCWWRSTGHIATYSGGQRIGPHCDDQISWEYGVAPTNEYPKHNNVSINIYLNDGVDSEEELNGTNFLGGDIIFKYAKYRHKPKVGSIAIYPTNYVGTHEVEPITAGKRIAYLGAYLYGTPANGSPIPQVGDSRIWMPNLRKDAGLEY